MKATGIVRSRQSRKSCSSNGASDIGYPISDPLEVYTDEDKIILKVYTRLYFLRQLNI